MEYINPYKWLTFASVINLLSENYETKKNRSFSLFIRYRTERYRTVCCEHEIWQTYQGGVTDDYLRGGQHCRSRGALSTD